MGEKVPFFKGKIAVSHRNGVTLSNKKRKKQGPTFRKPGPPFGKQDTPFRKYLVPSCPIIMFIKMVMTTGLISHSNKL